MLQLARPGRKRKSGRRTASGHLAREHVNYAALAAEQPHRRGLPVEARLSQDAVTELGRLSLVRLITETQKLAGEEYARRTAAYRAVVGGPPGTARSSFLAGCNPDSCSYDPDGRCECRRRVTEYQELFQVVNQCGRRVEMAVKRVVAHNEAPDAWELALLSLGLTALAAHLRLTERGKRLGSRNRGF